MFSYVPPQLLHHLTPAFASLLPGGPSGPLNSNIPGAFQPRVTSVSNLGPVPGRLPETGYLEKVGTYRCIV